jgi:hypothetical protein
MRIAGSVGALRWRGVCVVIFRSVVDLPDPKLLSLFYLAAACLLREL